MEDLDVHVPVRSISLPSRLLHPIESELINLKSFKSLRSSSSETLQIGLTKLTDLFICIEEIISHSPQTHQSFHRNREQVDDILDQSVGLIDICCTVRDVFLTIQEHIRDLQSALRRRGKDLSIENNVQAYITFRKKTKETITKSLRTLKRFMSSEEHHSSDVINVVREAYEAAANIFRCILLFLSLSEMNMNYYSTRWSNLSKMMRWGFLASDKDHQKIFNEVESVDIALCSIHGKIRKNDYSKQEVQERLNALSATIQELEANLNFVFRCLIQNRISLLNLVTP